MDKYFFMYCQKIVVFSKDETKVLLCKRKGEKDYDGMYSFIGGKMEVTDESIIEGLKREKNEEVGADFKIRLYPTYSVNNFFRKKDGNRMVLPHYYSIFQEGEITLNDEYSEYKWVPINELESFEPKIPNIPDYVNKVLELKKIMNDSELIVI